MPKVKWGGQELETALNEYDPDSSQDFAPYDGPEPPKGMYGWTISRMQQGTSKNDYPQIIVHLELDPRDRKEHEKYSGFYMRDYVIVKEDGSTDFRVRGLLDALGVTVREFLNGTIIGPPSGQDNNGNDLFPITKIGKLTIGGNKVRGNIWKRGEYFNIKYHSAAKTSAVESGPADYSGDHDEEAPF